MNHRAIIRLYAVSALVLVIGIIANYFASIYAIEKASNAVSDIILSNVPAYDVDGFFVFGAIAFWVFAAFILARNARKIPFSLQALGLILIVRAAFVMLTHIGPFPVHSVIDYNFFNFFTSGGDLFFSGHTAFPFMMALIFWDDIRLRVIGIGASVFFGAVVLLGHLHYSIDVAAAFFITYAVYHIATVIFKKGHEVFQNGWNPVAPKTLL
jgi:hypothetical protein